MFWNDFVVAKCPNIKHAKLKFLIFFIIVLSNKSLQKYKNF